MHNEGEEPEPKKKNCFNQTVLQLRDSWAKCVRFRVSTGISVGLFESISNFSSMMWRTKDMMRRSSCKEVPGSPQDAEEAREEVTFPRAQKEVVVAAVAAIAKVPRAAAVDIFPRDAPKDALIDPTGGPRMAVAVAVVVEEEAKTEENAPRKEEGEEGITSQRDPRAKDTTCPSVGGERSPVQDLLRLRNLPGLKRRAFLTLKVGSKRMVFGVDLLMGYAPSLEEPWALRHQGTHRAESSMKPTRTDRFPSSMDRPLSSAAIPLPSM